MGITLGWTVVLLYDGLWRTIGENVLVCRVDVGWLLVLHGSCTSFSYGLLLKLVSSCAAPQDFGLIPKWHELSFLIFAIDQKCCVSHFVQYNSNLSCSAIIKLIFFVNVRFSRNYMFEMSKFKKITEEGKIQKLVETHKLSYFKPVHWCPVSHNWQHSFSIL
jgi:hypothetical protein